MKSSIISTTANAISSGGSISGDLTISGDLSVTGSTAITTDEVLQGTSIIDVNDTEAFLVRKDSDGGDIFIVDTTNSRVGIGGTPTSALMHIYANDTTKWQSTIEQDGTGDSALKFSLTGERDWLIGVDNSDGNKFKISYDANDLNDLTALTLDTSGNVGIGVSPVANRLHLHEPDSTQVFAHFTNTTTGTTHNDGLLVGVDGDEQSNIWNRENTATLFATNDTERMRIDASGKGKY